MHGFIFAPLTIKANPWLSGPFTIRTAAVDSLPQGGVPLLNKLLPRSQKIEREQEQ